MAAVAKPSAPDMQKIKIAVLSVLAVAAIAIFWLNRGWFGLGRVANIVHRKRRVSPDEDNRTVAAPAQNPSAARAPLPGSDNY